MLFLLLRSALSSNYGILYIHILRGLVQHVSHGYWVVLVYREQELLGLESVGEGSDQESSASSISSAFLLNRVTYDLKL